MGFYRPEQIEIANLRDTIDKALRLATVGMLKWNLRFARNNADYTNWVPFIEAELERRNVND